MQLNEIAVGNQVVWANLLTVEHVCSPDASELQVSCNVLVHQLGDVVYRVAATRRERFVVVGRLAG